MAEDRTSDRVDATSFESAFATLYQELKALARAQRRRFGTDTISTTALVHDLYLQVAKRSELQFQQPIQFFSYAAQAMRHLLTDRARAKSRLKAGGDLTRAELDDADLPASQEVSERALELDEALKRLALTDGRAAEVVELHFFAGLEFDRIAELKGLSRRTVHRDWRFARAFLHTALGDS